MIYLKLADVRISVERVAERVRAGGHQVPERDIRRRFGRSWINFKNHYQSLADASWVFDVSGVTPKLLHQTP
jgi:predicted ABC-type ATPase